MTQICRYLAPHPRDAVRGLEPNSPGKLALGLEPIDRGHRVRNQGQQLGPQKERGLDVRNGDLHEVHDLIEERPGKQTVRWTSITLRAAKRPRQKKGRWHGYDWDGAWAYALTLRAEDQWDWTQDRRHKKQPLPAVRNIVEKKIQQWFAARGSVPDLGDIRRNITGPLYAGRRTRGKRKR